jgi:hypothetical protein
MKLRCAITTSEVTREALTVFADNFEQKMAKEKTLGYNGVELMLRDPSKLFVFFQRYLVQGISTTGLTGE